MSFVNPLLLIGILAAGIPLLIHLWSRRRARLVDFSYVRFLISLHRRKVKRLKLKQILILILRMLAVALIALAFARPVLTSKWALAAGSRARSSVVIVLDNSYSMGYETFDGTRFDLAKKQALRLLESLRPGDDASLILMSDLADVIFKRLTPDIQQVRRAIEEAGISHRGSSAWVSMWEAYTLLERSDNPYKVVYLISDLGENGWTDWKKPPDDLNAVDVFVIRTGESEASNKAVENVILPDEPVGIGMTVEVSARLTESDIKAGTTVELFVDGEKKGQTVTKEETVSFTHTFQHPGTHIGEVRLTADRLPLDDARRFAINIPGQIKVVCAGDHRFYVNLALNPVTSLNPEAEFSILPVSCTIEELGALSLDQYNVVILADLSILPGGIAQRLERFVLNGGKLVIFLGETTDRDWYNSSFSPALVKLGDRMSFSKAPLKLSSWSAVHPVFRTFQDEGMAGVLESPRFLSAFSMKPEAGANVIARFAGNIPAVLEAEAGLGKIMIFNTSPDTNVSDFSLSPAFLPLMQQTVFYLVSGDQYTSRNIIVGDTYVRDVQASIDSPPEVFDPADNVAAPVLTATGRGSRIEYGPLERAGVYRLEFISEGSRQRDYFAVNPDTVGEPHLKAAKDSDITNKLGERARFVSLDDFSIDSGFESMRSESRSEISSRLLLAALILMLVEVPLANRRRYET